MKILAMHDGTGCGYYRIVLPMRQLAAHGHDVTIKLGKDVKASYAADWPLIVGQRIDKQSALAPWRRFRARSKLVYEVDDDVFTVQPVNWEAYGVYSREETRDAVSHAAQVANMVTVTVRPLAEVMARFNDRVEILPNFIPELALTVAHEPRQRPRVGWAGGASHGLDISEVARPFREFLNRHPGWDGLLAGTDYRPTIKHDRVAFADWNAIQDNPAAYYQSLNFDIGLAPLSAAGDSFNRSKSHIKALEYASQGIPVIASDSAPYRDFVLHGVTGFLVKRDHEWLTYLEELADPVTRAEMGAKARERAREFTIEGNWQLWEQVYERI